MNTDYLQRFSFDGTDVRGEITLLKQTFQEIQQRHQYPRIIQQQLGQLLAAAALLSANLKFAGRLTLQVRLHGDVRLLQAETNEQGQLRAIARFNEEAELNELSFTDGQLVITIEPEQGQKYQGITAISGGNIAAALEEYFSQSEQLPSYFWLFADEQQAGAFMLQKIPAAADASVDPDAWERLHHLAATLKQEELFGLPPEDVLHRLFHEEQARVFPATALSFYCTCSKPRIGNALHQLGYDELNDMLNETSKIQISCEFCQQRYSFDRDDVEALFPERHPH